MNINQARTAYNNAVDAMNAAGDRAERALENLPANATAKQIADCEEPFNLAKEEVARTRGNLERAEALAEGRAGTDVIVSPADSRSYATARGSLRADSVYRPDQSTSFFSDMYMSQRYGDPDARERVDRSHRQSLDELNLRTSIGSSDIPGFTAPTYLTQHYAELPRAARPFADILPKLQMPEFGASVVFPRVTTGSTVASQSAENQSVSQTEPAETDYTAPVVTVAGQVDLSRQLVERSAYPGFDMVVYSDLAAAYDAELDRQLLNGLGTSGEHKGIRLVSGINTGTASTATGASVLSVAFGQVSAIASNRYRNPTHVIMHPRRAAWLASQTSSTPPVFQQGQLFQSFGTQDGGLLSTFAGLPVVKDANVIVTANPGTGQDECYIVYAPDLLLMETPLRSLRFEDVGSGTLAVRLQVLSYSAFASGRQPKAISALSGAAFASPSFG